MVDYEKVVREISTIVDTRWDAEDAADDFDILNEIEDIIAAAREPQNARYPDFQTNKDEVA